jgi:methylmalonyl-CoA mutase N-terminal domain/subunit
MSSRGKPLAEIARSDGSAEPIRAHSPATDSASTEAVAGETRSGIPVLKSYVAADSAEAPAGGASIPGEYPFTRGIAPDGYRKSLWVMGQYSGYGSPEETNKRIRALIENGQRGFSIALDLPTQMGLDSDHELAAGEVGRVGVPIDTVQDMIDLLAGVPLDKVRQIRTTASSIGPIAVAFLVVAAEHLGYAPSQFRVMLQNDVLKEYIARGTYIFPPEPALEFAVDVIEYCARELPSWEPIEFCGYHIRDSGATAVEEIAIAIGNGLEYIECAIGRGLDPSTFTRQIYMFLSSGLEILEEVAKFRAARRMWARLMRERFNLGDECCALNLFAYTLGGSLTAKEPLNNVVRVAYEALAAVLGGVQTLATSSFDEAIQLPSPQAVKVALRTQQIIGYESGVARVADPLGGSYYVEALTDEIEARASDFLAKIESLGGALAALKCGFLQEEISERAYEQQLSIEQGNLPVVGLNYFADRSEPGGILEVLRASPDAEDLQRRRVAQVRASRNNNDVQRALGKVREAALSRSNTIPSLIDAARSLATIGEIVGTLKDVWGHWP